MTAKASGVEEEQMQDMSIANHPDAGGR